MAFYESNIKCPYCYITVRINWKHSEMLREPQDNQETGTAIQLFYECCTNCRKLIVGVNRGYQSFAFGHNQVTDPLWEKIVYPMSTTIMSGDFIPEFLYNEYLEAVEVLPVSPKASAALTRRILQGVFREKYNIEKRTLDAEISEFIKLPNIPTHLSNAVDAIRWIGNFAAHPLKNQNTQAICDVEPGEAEWSIEVIEALFDFTYIQPQKLELKRNLLNEKLKAAGKPTLR